MSQLILTSLKISGTPCIVAALRENNRVLELRLGASEEKKLLGNIYVGQVETLAANIQAAFVQITPGQRAYFPLNETSQLIYAAGQREGNPLRPGDEILVQVSREAMRGKLPALTANLSFTGKFLVLTTGNRKIGYSSRLSAEEKACLEKWMQEEKDRPDRGYGYVVRTNAGQATKDEFFHEMSWLKRQYEKNVLHGRNRTCFSLLCEPEPFYISAVRDANSRDLTEIVTDLPEIQTRVSDYLQETSPEETEKIRFYSDSLLPLYKLYRLETALETVSREKVWLNSGGFLVIQQTEAFVSIDVNSGKYTGKKKQEETWRKINLEAAREIAWQLRLRNLSGIILIDFINMENPDHRDELFHVLQKYLREDPVKSKVVDITPLQIVEMTRKKVRRPVLEEIRRISSESSIN
ncbi:MAG: ribonuclease E/G [Clostridiales bacterium]|nr:ribonuclease E/G [Clostridiales bacterium]